MILNSFINIIVIVASMIVLNKWAWKKVEKIEVAERSLELMSEELYKYEIDKIDFLHTIKLPNTGLLDTSKMDEIYEQGYLQTKEKMTKIEDYLK